MCILYIDDRDWTVNFEINHQVCGNPKPVSSLDSQCSSSLNWRDSTHKWYTLPLQLNPPPGHGTPKKQQAKHLHAAKSLAGEGLLVSPAMERTCRLPLRSLCQTNCGSFWQSLLPDIILPAIERRRKPERQGGSRQLLPEFLMYTRA